MRTRVLLMVSSMRGGGSERQVLLLAKHLDRSRFEPHLYLTEAAGDFLDQVPGDIPVHSFDRAGNPAGLYFPGKELRRQTAYLRNLIREQRFAAVYERTFQMTLIGGAAANGARRIATIVSPPHLALPLVETRFVKLKRRRLAAAYRSADAVVAVSRQAADSAESYYRLRRGSVKVIPNPVDIEALRQAASDASARPLQPREQSSTRLVCVGRMTAEKGHCDLLEALHAARNRCQTDELTLRLIGDGPLRGELESKAKSLGIDEQITFLGPLPSAAAEIAIADALVLPSRFEGMPNVVLEAMALGTSVIATRSGGTIELEGDVPTAFWAEPANPTSLADAMVRFVEDRRMAAQHAAAAWQRIVTNHDMATAVERIERLLLGEQSR